jgi:phi LC3 family holin
MKSIKINIPVRMKNPVFWVQVFGAFLLSALTYNQLQPQDLTTWEGLVNLIVGVFKNPYLLCMCLWSAWSAFNDPTTKGIADSENALSYNEPK